IRRTEGRALRERDKKIIDEVWTPASACKLAAFVFWNLHLWEKKTVTPKFVVFMTFGWPAAIDPPIPQRKDNDVGQPQQCGGKQKLKRRFPVRGQRVHQQHHGSN